MGKVCFKAKKVDLKFISLFQIVSILAECLGWTQGYKGKEKNKSPP